MFRYLASQSLKMSGMMRLWRRLHRERISVLTIHSVLDPDEADWIPLRNFLPLENLREGLTYLRRQQCNFISLADAMEVLEGKRAPIHNAIVITFDDGYMNNFTYAMPVLKALEVPATYFMVTNRIENRIPFWFDRIDFALQKNISDKYRLRVFDKTVTVNGADRASLRKAMLESFAIISSAGLNDRDLDARVGKIIEPVESLKGQTLMEHYDDKSPCAIVTLPVLKQAVRSEFVTLGSHTHHHTRLPTMPSIDVTEELRRSSEWLAQHVNYEVDQFCYPNGSYDRRTANLVKDAGYRCAVTCVEGQNSIAAHSPMRLRRINWSNNATPVELLALSCGVYRDSLFGRLGKTSEVVDESGPPLRTAGIANASID